MVGAGADVYLIDRAGERVNWIEPDGILFLYSLGCYDGVRQTSEALSVVRS
jgi:hypothetical protein